MARNRTSAQKTQAKVRFVHRLQDGAEIIASRLLANGQTVIYRARVILHPDGRVDLTSLGSYRAKAYFKPAVDLQVPGYRDWFIISGIPVCMAGRYRSLIAAIMRFAPYSD
jgi:hypothetical protein